MDRKDGQTTNVHENDDVIKESVCVKIRSSRAAAVCLVLLCVLLLTAVIVLCVHIHTKSSNYTPETHQLLTNITNSEERDQLLTMITNLTQERDGLKIKNKNLTNERDQLLTNITNLSEERDGLKIKTNNLTNERDQLKLEKNDLQMILGKLDGWVYSKSSLYFISSEKRNWTESRRYCTERGADLIIINNRAEQEFVSFDNFWIGLTDSDEEGRWKWVDGTNMTYEFWWIGEPNNSNNDEDCAYTFSSGWNDYPCNRVIRWICETAIRIRRDRAMPQAQPTEAQAGLQKAAEEPERQPTKGTQEGVRKPTEREGRKDEVKPEECSPDGFVSNSFASFWIGLTDSDVEGRWKWVDGTNMTYE
ncbi:asialoglycoprotein receptor 1-like [Chanodichthys erythropterus]|uniref:asialoglycoprotein receptor 1-like n=1 Tax=Chanodichthys erythropterus TaxID=933992 RepID=UPI00351DE19B